MGEERSGRDSFDRLSGAPRVMRAWGTAVLTPISPHVGARSQACYAPLRRAEPIQPHVRVCSPGRCPTVPVRSAPHDRPASTRCPTGSTRSAYPRSTPQELHRTAR